MNDETSKKETFVNNFYGAIDREIIGFHGEKRDCVRQM